MIRMRGDAECFSTHYKLASVPSEMTRPPIVQDTNQRFHCRCLQHFARFTTLLQVRRHYSIVQTTTNNGDQKCVFRAHLKRSKSTSLKTHKRQTLSIFKSVWRPIAGDKYSFCIFKFRTFVILSLDFCIFICMIIHHHIIRTGSSPLTSPESS